VLQCILYDLMIIFSRIARADILFLEKYKYMYLSEVRGFAPVIETADLLRSLENSCRYMTNSALVSSMQLTLLACVPYFKVEHYINSTVDACSQFYLALSTCIHYSL